MKPIIKWQGGKRRELKHIQPFINGAHTIAEPFCGGAAVAFDNEGIAYLNDTNPHLINLYKTLQNRDHFERMLIDIEQAQSADREELYYTSRQIVNRYDFTDAYQSAFAFFLLRQQCFSGMERYNGKGEFNVPFGHYKTLASSLSEQHHNFLRASHLSCLDAIEFMGTLPADAFIFLDPPYLDRAGYKEGDGGLDLHSSIAVTLKDITQPWLLVHVDDDFYRYAYRDFNIKEVGFKYSQQWKGRETKSQVTHLYITNF